MKTQMAVICALAQGLSMAEARIGQRFEVEADGINFDIDYSDSGASNPYSVIFRQDGVRSKYRFRLADGFTRKLNIGDLLYSAVYRTRDDSLKRVNDLNDRRVLVTQDFDEAVEEENEEMHHGRRLALLSCDDCSTVWNLICEGGMDTLCDEIEYGVPPLVDQPTVETSIDVMCNVFRPVCEEYTGEMVCDDQCEDCFSALTITLEWSDRDTDMDLYVTEPDGTEIRFNNRAGSVGYLEEDNISGGPETYRVWSGLSTAADEVLGTYKFAARLVNNRGDAETVDWVLTAEMNGETVKTKSGTFDSNGDQSDNFRYTLESYIDNGCDNESLISIIAAAEGDSDTKPGSP